MWKDALKRETETAIARGVFGSPFVIVDGEPFWGLDRFDQLERRLAATAPRDGRVLAVSHLRLIAVDLPAMVAFYRDALGLDPAVDVPGTYAEFATAGARLALCGEATMGAVVGRSPPRAGDAVVVCLRVDDVDATHAKLAARGVTFVRSPHDQPAWHQRVAHLRDPAGNLVELWTPLAPLRAPETERWPSTRSGVSPSPATRTRRRSRSSWPVPTGRRVSSTTSAARRRLRRSAPST